MMQEKTPSVIQGRNIRTKHPYDLHFISSCTNFFPLDNGMVHELFREHFRNKIREHPALATGRCQVLKEVQPILDRLHQTAKEQHQQQQVDVCFRMWKPILDTIPPKDKHVRENNWEDVSFEEITSMFFFKRFLESPLRSALKDVRKTTTQTDHPPQKSNGEKKSKCEETKSKRGGHSRDIHVQPCDRGTQATTPADVSYHPVLLEPDEIKAVHSTFQRDEIDSAEDDMGFDGGTGAPLDKCVINDTDIDLWRFGGSPLDDDFDTIHCSGKKPKRTRRPLTSVNAAETMVAEKDILNQDDTTSFSDCLSAHQEYEVQRKRLEELEAQFARDKAAMMAKLAFQESEVRRLKRKMRSQNERVQSEADDHRKEEEEELPISVAAAFASSLPTLAMATGKGGDIQLAQKTDMFQNKGEANNEDELPPGLLGADLFDLATGDVEDGVLQHQQAAARTPGFSLCHVSVPDAFDDEEDGEFNDEEEDFEAADFHQEDGGAGHDIGGRTGGKEEDSSSLREDVESFVKPLFLEEEDGATRKRRTKSIFVLGSAVLMAAVGVVITASYGFADSSSPTGDQAARVQSVPCLVNYHDRVSFEDMSGSKRFAIDTSGSDARDSNVTRFCGIHSSSKGQLFQYSQRNDHDGQVMVTLCPQNADDFPLGIRASVVIGGGCDLECETSQELRAVSSSSVACDNPSTKTKSVFSWYARADTNYSVFVQSPSVGGGPVKATFQRVLVPYNGGKGLFEETTSTNTSLGGAVAVSGSGNLVATTREEVFLDGGVDERVVQVRFFRLSNDGSGFVEDGELSLSALERPLMGYEIGLSNDGNALVVANDADFSIYQRVPSGINSKTWDLAMVHAPLLQTANDTAGGTTTETGTVSISGDGDTAIWVAQQARDLGQQHVVVFRKGSSSSWEPLQNLPVAGASPSSGGKTAALSRDGKRLVVLGPLREARLFGFMPTDGEWKQVGVVGHNNVTSVTMDESGMCVAVTMETRTSLVLQVWCFEESSGALAQRGQTLPDNDMAQDAPLFKFGPSISLASNGTVLVVGTNDDDDSSRGGHVLVYQFDQDNRKWRLVANVHSPNSVGGGGKRFGQSVDVSSDASVLVVGAPAPEMEAESGNPKEVGAVHVFKLFLE